MKPAPGKKDKWYDVEIPIPPTSIIVEAGHRLAIAVRANDEEEIISPMRHIGPDRSEEVFAGTNRIVLGGKLMLPVLKRS